MARYIFYHYIIAWIMPPGIQIFLLLFAILVMRIWPLFSRILIVLSIITLWLASAPIVSYNLLEILQNRYPPLQLSSIHFKHGAIVVLGGGSETAVEENNKDILSEVTLNRVRYAALLSKKTRLPIIVSGGRRSSFSRSEADIMQETLQNYFGIQTSLKDDKGGNTEEESRFVAQLVKQYHFDGIVLVTNAWHMPRSMFSFERVGILTVPAPMGYKVYDHHYTMLSYFPNVYALQATNTALREFLGLLWYRFSDKKIIP